MAPAIQVSALRKAYGSIDVLRGVDFEVEPGSIVGLIGLNGAGKTTTLSVLLGLLAADGGEARILGVPAGNVASLGARLGAALHRPGLEPQLTMEQNLRLHALRHGRPASGIAGLLERLGLAHLRARRVCRLSQGERQRLAVVQALLLQPDALVLDEPISNLDPGAVHTVLDVLRAEARRGAAVLLSSHQLDHVERVADHLAILHKGRVVASGSVSDLLGAAAKTLLLALRAPPSCIEEVRALPLVTRADVVDGAMRARFAHHYDETAYTLLRVSLAEDRPEALSAALAGRDLPAALLQPERATLDDLFQRIVAEAPPVGSAAGAGSAR